MKNIHRFKWCVIVSQVGLSYNCFIVKINKKNYLEKCKQVIDGINFYRTEKQNDGYYGDFTKLNDQDNIKDRYNFNSSKGDIYFINSTIEHPRSLIALPVLKPFFNACRKRDLRLSPILNIISLKNC